MSVAHMGERCACGGEIAVPGKPQEDSDGRIIGYRFVCAECGATMWTTWTEEYEAEQSAKARHEEDAETMRSKKAQEACAINRARHAQMRDWMHQMEAWAKESPAVKTFLARQVAAYGHMDIWTPAWTYQVTGTTYNAALAIMEAVA